LFPVNADCPRGDSDHSTATSFLPANSDPLLPAKPDSPGTACSQWTQIVREVIVIIPPLPASSQRSQIYCYQRSEFHPYLQCGIYCYHHAPSEARSTATSESSFTLTSEARSTANSFLPEMPDCQIGESYHVRAVRQSISEVGKWLCQSCGCMQISGESEHVRVGVKASMPELLGWACDSCGSELVGVIRARVYACQRSK
jgi:hypothetical protein